jgi:hypothetical protein
LATAEIVQADRTSPTAVLIMKAPIAARASALSSSSSRRTSWRRRSASSSSSSSSLRRKSGGMGTAVVLPALVAMILVGHKSQWGLCFLSAPPPAAVTKTNLAVRESTRGAFRSSAAVSTASTRLPMASAGGDGGPEPLATEGDWSAYLDDQSTGLVYYFNAR